MNPAAPEWRGSHVQSESRDRDLGLRRYFLVLAAIWVIVMTARIYPQFGDTLRIEGRLTTLSEYVDESCTQRIGPAAASCKGEAWDTGSRLVAREQGKSVLLVEAPLLGYLLLYLPLRWAINRAKTGRRPSAPVEGWRLEQRPHDNG